MTIIEKFNQDLCTSSFKILQARVIILWGQGHHLLSEWLHELFPLAPALQHMHDVWIETDVHDEYGQKCHHAASVLIDFINKCLVIHFKVFHVPIFRDLVIINLQKFLQILIPEFSVSAAIKKVPKVSKSFDSGV